MTSKVIRTLLPTCIHIWIQKRLWWIQTNIYKIRFWVVWTNKEGKHKQIEVLHGNNYTGSPSKAKWQVSKNLWKVHQQFIILIQTRLGKVLWRSVKQGSTSYFQPSTFNYRCPYCRTRSKSSTNIQMFTAVHVINGYHPVLWDQVVPVFCTSTKASTLK